MGWNSQRCTNVKRLGNTDKGITNFREVAVTDTVSNIHNMGRWSTGNTELSHVLCLQSNSNEAALG